MVKDVSSKKAKVDKVIDDYGTLITFTPISTETYDEDNGWTTSDGATYTANVIPYDYVSGKQSFDKQGNLNEGDIRLITKGDITINEKDKFEYNSKTYFVTKVNPLPLAGIDLAIVVDGSEQI